MALGVQMDVDEFFNMLFDRQEDLLRTTPFTDLLRIFFGGVNVNQMISKDPEVPYVGEREESWFTISVDVKNKKNLEESLASYCAGEMLEGDNKYYVEDFDKKVCLGFSFSLALSTCLFPFKSVYRSIFSPFFVGLLSLLCPSVRDALFFIWV